MDIETRSTDDIIWPISSDPRPYFSIGCGDYPTQYHLDPFPGYAADAVLAKELVAECCEAFPIGHRGLLAILDREGTDRANACTAESYIYSRADGSKWEDQINHFDGSDKKVAMMGQAHTIVLYGKRTPIHPAMVRYLVAHEYGHAVANYLRRAMGCEERYMELFEAEYMRVRGVADYRSPKYSARLWHTHAGEIMANDFRMLLTGRESEYWPHKVELPTAVPAIVEWWEKAKALRYTEST